MARKPRPLTPKQAAFVRYYTAGDTIYNATRSAQKAGYRGNDVTLKSVGYENLSKPHIQRGINRVLLAAFTVTDLTVDSVIAKLEQHRILAMQFGHVGHANKALEMQGKYLKMFADRVEHVHSIEEATDGDLVNLLNQLIGKIDGFNIDGFAGIPGGGGSSQSSDGDTPGAQTTH